jgi:tetratricopeptide (TPR) repeat protein
MSDSSELRRLVATGYDQIADEYLARYGRSSVRDRWLSELTSLLSERPHARVLDLGCGAGVPAAQHLMAGRYEEALEWADRSLHEQPHYSPSLRGKVVSFVQTGRLDEARDFLRSLLELQPGLTIAWYRRFAARFLPPDTLAVGLESFRKAGLPEA